MKKDAELVDPTEIATYEHGKPVIEGNSGAIEIFRMKAGERMLVAGVVMLEGLISVPEAAPVGEKIHDGVVEREAYDKCVASALSEMSVFYDRLPAELRAKLESDEREKNEILNKQTI